MVSSREMESLIHLIPTDIDRQAALAALLGTLVERRRIDIQETFWTLDGS